MIIRDSFCYFCTKTYVVTPHQNRFVETVQIKGLMRNKTNYPSAIIKYSSYVER